MNKRKIIIYLAGRYGDNSNKVNLNIGLARWFAIELWEKGYTVICPHLNTTHMEMDCNLKSEDYLEGDLRMLKNIDVLFLLPGWQESKGANKEYAEALKLSKAICYQIDELEKVIRENNIL